MSKQKIDASVAAPGAQMSDERRLKQATSLEHMRNQTGMYLGNKAVIKSREYRIADGQAGKNETSLVPVHLLQTRLSPACVKIMDEIVVNAVDQYTLLGCNIMFDWDEDGSFSVTNTGSGFELYDVATEDGRKMISLQMAFGEFRTSTNFNLDEESITGGMNGVGGKGANAFSWRFEVETYCKKTDQYCRIVWTDCMQKVKVEELERNPEDKVPFVRVTLCPAYDDFNMTGADGKTPDKDLLEQFRQMFYMRALHTAAFCQHAKVYWNDVRLDMTPSKLVRMKLLPHVKDNSDDRPNLDSTDAVKTIQFDLVHRRGLKNKTRFRHGSDLRMTVVLAVKDNKEQLEQWSVINGIYIKEGTLLDTFVEQIVDYIRPLWIELKDPSKKAKAAKKAQATLAEVQSDLEKVKAAKKAAAEGKKTAGSAGSGASKEEKAKATARHTALVAREKELRASEKAIKEKEADAPKFDARVITKYLHVAVFGYVNRPSFTGQRKDKLDSPQEQFADYRIPEQRLADFWDVLRPMIEFDIFKSATRGQKGAKNVKCPHHDKAQYYGTKNKHQAVLMCAEGDSAAGTLDKMRSAKGSQISNKTHGIFTLGGVIMNVRREITVKVNPKTGERVVVLSQRFRENERMQELFTVLNLDVNRTYETAEERETLDYGQLHIATDQDEDGKGNIRSGVGNLFQTLWPALIKCGFVRFLRTPIVRCIPKGARDVIQEFFTEEDFREWEAKASESGAVSLARRWEIVYYKGLGSHGDDEVENMARKYDSMVITFTLDKHSEAACNVYFGEDPELRKMVLVKRPKWTEEHYYTEVVRGGERVLSVSFTDHLNTETKSFQLYNIARHIEDEIDGDLPSRRKVFCGSRRMVPSRIKTFQLGGDVARKMGYHHGDASMNQCITGESQSFPGGREMPRLLALSNAGSRKKGGTDAGSARYTFVKPNRRLGDALCPPEDDFILEWTFDDGQRCEPVHYIPIVPRALLENYNSMGHGWANKVWARDYWEVSAWTRHCIKNGMRVHAREKDFGISRHRFRDRIETFKGVENSVGTYTRTGADSIEITEMPRCMWNEHFLYGNPNDKKSKGVADEDYITEQPLDLSTDSNISIELRFRPGFLDSLPVQKEGEPDPIIKLLDLKQSLKPQLNFIGMSGAVVERQRYTDVFDAWFPVRLDAYRRRILRMCIILRLRIEMMEEQLKYIGMREKLGISGCKKAKQNEIIEKAGFPTFDKPLLDQPSYTRISELADMVRTGDGASWDYLRKMDADDLSTEGEQSLTDKIAETRAELLEYSAEDAIEKTWLRELDALDAVVKRAQEENWLFGEPKKRWAEDRNA